MIACLIFDLDGTLVDSSQANVKSYGQAFNELGLVFDAQKYESLFGLRFPEIMDRIAPDTSASQRDDIKKLKAKYYKQNLGLIQLNADLVELARAAKSHYKIALVTTASKANVRTLLEHFELDGLFDKVIVGEDVKHGKPNPECYLLAARSFGFEPQDCLVFEDSQVGMEAARAAGAKAVKVAI